MKSIQNTEHMLDSEVQAKMQREEERETETEREGETEKQGKLSLRVKQRP
jgi:hypothetical protein